MATANPDYQTAVNTWAQQHPDATTYDINKRLSTLPGASYNPITKNIAYQGAFYQYPSGASNTGNNTGNTSGTGGNALSFLNGATGGASTAGAGGASTAPDRYAPYDGIYKSRMMAYDDLMRSGNVKGAYDYATSLGQNRAGIQDWNNRYWGGQMYTPPAAGNNGGSRVSQNSQFTYTPVQSNVGTPNVQTQTATGPVYNPNFNQSVDPATMTIEGRLPGLLASDSPVLRQAMESANGLMSQRGLLNSSAGVQAANEALISKAIDIAQPDAKTYFDQSINNQNAQNRFAENYQNQNYDLQSRGVQQGYDLQKLGLQHDYSLEDLAVGHGYDMESAFTQYGYDLDKLRTGHAYDLETIGVQDANQTRRDSTLHGYERDILELQNQYKTDGVDNEQAFTLQRDFIKDVRGIDTTYQSTLNTIATSDLDEAGKTAQYNAARIIRDTNVQLSMAAYSEMPNWNRDWARSVSGGLSTSLGDRPSGIDVTANPNTYSRDQIHDAITYAVTDPSYMSDAQFNAFVDAAVAKGVLPADKVAAIKAAHGEG